MDPCRFSMSPPGWQFSYRQSCRAGKKSGVFLKVTFISVKELEALKSFFFFFYKNSSESQHDVIYSYAFSKLIRVVKIVHRYVFITPFPSHTLSMLRVIEYLGVFHLSC